jgi:hypothetical protein
MEPVHCFDIFELPLGGPAEGNPYREVSLSARFWRGNRTLEIEGFYDGEGRYGIRLMPDEVGEWRYQTRSSSPGLNGIRGTFECLPAREGVHGPVRVADSFHFAYADGTRHLSFGTTCYAWVHQPAALQEQTLETLASAPFNKMRMCIFPKDYTYNKNEPPFYPFVFQPEGGFDFTCPDPAFWRNFERRVGQLAALGIEADLILFHPYDRWGFASMGAENDDFYLRYAIARLAAHRNVWWSLANEYDVNRSKTLADWARFLRIIQTHDPHRHLCSNHNWIMLGDHATKTFYDFSQPGVSHCSIQHAHTDLTGEWRERYRKPVVIDEACYEGDIPNGWGNISAQEMAHRFWEAVVRGGYCGHGETYLDENDILWWSKGGTLKGESPGRIAFLRKILDEMPAGWIEPLGRVSDSSQPSGGILGKFILHYFGRHQPARVTFDLPEGNFGADVLDTWEMTVSPVEGVFHKKCSINLPGKPFMAVRIVRLD